MYVCVQVGDCMCLCVQVSDCMGVGVQVSVSACLIQYCEFEQMHSGV